MKREISLFMALLWALVAEARINENIISRERGDVKKHGHGHSGRDASSLTTEVVMKAEKKSSKKSKSDDDDDDDSGDGLLDLLPAWFDLLRPCKLLENQFDGAINCEVMLLIPLLIERQIKFEIYTEEVCGGLTQSICTTPGFEGIIDFDDRWVSSNIFFEDITIGPIKIGTLNFGLDVCLDRSEDDDDDTGRMLTEGSDVHLGGGNVSSTVSEAFVDNPGLCTCEVSLAGYACNSCEFCANGGISFDCSNIVVGVTNNGSCDTLEGPQSLLGNGQKIKPSFPNFLLNLNL